MDGKHHVFSSTAGARRWKIIAILVVSLLYLLGHIDLIISISLLCINWPVAALGSLHRDLQKINCCEVVTQELNLITALGMSHRCVKINTKLRSGYREARRSDLADWFAIFSARMESTWEALVVRNQLDTEISPGKLWELLHTWRRKRGTTGHHFNLVVFRN
jgi:hypothetical protein